MLQLNCNWIALLLVCGPALWAGESGYFITYTHQMEEPGNLEVSLISTTSRPEGGNRFINTLTELEYGVKGWWTTEVYVHGQTTFGDSSVFTGYRWENRFRLLPREHWINPVLYVEWEHVNGADRSLLEVVGFDARGDLLNPNAEARREKERELETRLILSSNVKGWNISENFIAEKNLAHAPFEFGYAVAASRPLALEAIPKPCSWCRENFRLGVELYGGLGTHEYFGIQPGTSHYVAPTVAWQLPSGLTLAVSPGFGLTRSSDGFLVRVSTTYEIAQFSRAIRGLFRKEKQCQPCSF